MRGCVIKGGMEKDLLQEFIRIQKELLPRIKLEDSFRLEQIRLIAGVDLAYWDAEDKTRAVCCTVVVDYHGGEVAEKVYSWGEITVPYRSGFLAFRELPLVMETVKKLRKGPDLYIFDGNGYLHNRHMGIATHGALTLNKPSIGVAKSLLFLQGLEYAAPENVRGAYTEILCNGEVCGRALRSRENVKPIFVSCGNWVSLNTATEIVMNLVSEESRLPVPLRLADLCSREMRKELQNPRFPNLTT